MDVALAEEPHEGDHFSGRSLQSPPLRTPRLQAMNATPSDPASFVDGLAQPPACNSAPPSEYPGNEPFGLGPLWDSMHQRELQSMGLVRPAGPAQLCD